MLVPEAAIYLTMEFYTWRHKLMDHQKKPYVVAIINIDSTCVHDHIEALKYHSLGVLRGDQINEVSMYLN